RLDLRLIAGRLGLLAKASGGSRWPLFVLAFALRTLLRVWDAFLVSLVMQLALALPMAQYFHRAIALGVPANILAVPLAGVALGAAFFALSLSAIATW